MSHYDCKNCGTDMGIDYGDCTVCTPPEVFSTKKQLDFSRAEAAAAWDKEHRDARLGYIKEYAGPDQRIYNAVYEAGKNWWRGGGRQH